MFTQTRFLGASVSNFNCTLGYNEQSSSLSVKLVEDTSAGDSFTRPEVGTPAFFSITNPDNGFVWEFGGLVQSWVYSRSTSGFLYDVVVTDPREILAGTQVIIGNYVGSTNFVPNLVNVYGFQESFGFGNALVNESGMPWERIRAALNVILSQTSGIFALTQFGGPRLRFRGSNYILDLSNIPSMPQYYRVGGTSISILDLIGQVCQDQGSDYFVRLTQEFIDGAIQNVIRIHTVSRRIDPPLNLIENFVNSHTNVSSKSIGRELRNEVTSAMIIGDSIRLMWQQPQVTLVDENEDGELDDEEAPAEDYTICPYWGLDASGNAILGRGDYESDEHSFTVDSRHIAVAGVGDTYTLDVGEIIIALEDFEKWKGYIEQNDPEKANRIGIGDRTFKLTRAEIRRVFGGYGTPGRIGKKDKTYDVNEDLFQEGLQRLHNFVKSIGDEYYGRKFMVTIPFINRTQEAETGLYKFDYEPTDAAYVEGEEVFNPITGRTTFVSAAETLGIPEDQKIIFTTEQGLFLPFVKFDTGTIVDVDEDPIPKDGAEKLNLSGVSLQDVAIVRTNSRSKFMDKESFSLLMKCAVEPYIVFLDRVNLTSPRAVITLSDPIYGIRQNDIGQRYTRKFKLEHDMPKHVAGNLKFYDRLLRWQVLEPRSSALSTVMGLNDLNTEEGLSAIDFYTKTRQHTLAVVEFFRRFGEVPELVTRNFVNDAGRRYQEFRLSPRQLDLLKGFIETKVSFTIAGTTNDHSFYHYRMPDYAAIPLKSNTQTYGPWYRIGPSGKVYFEQDTTLNPWNYGGSTQMYVAGNAKLFSIVTNMQQGETGSVEVAGIPEIQLGDALLSGGPIITSIDVSVSDQGIKTSYQMRTYTPEFGTLAKLNADRFQRLTAAQQRMQRQILSNQQSTGAAGFKGDKKDLSRLYWDNTGVPSTLIGKLT